MIQSRNSIKGNLFYTSSLLLQIFTFSCDLYLDYVNERFYKLAFYNKNFLKLIGAMINKRDVFIKLEIAYLNKEKFKNHCKTS